METMITDGAPKPFCASSSDDGYRCSLAAGHTAEHFSPNVPLGEPTRWVDGYPRVRQS